MDPVRLVERIGGVDLTSASTGQVAATINDLGRLKGWIAQQEGAAARRARELEAAGQSGPAVDLIARGSKTSRRTAEQAERRGEALGHTPEVEHQLGKGSISTEHADALARAANKLTDDTHRAALFARDRELAEHAASSTPAQFSRRLAKLVDEIAADDGVERSEQQRRQATLSHGVNTDTGMGWIRAELHPDDYQKAKRRIDAEARAITHSPEHDGRRHEQVAAAAFVGLVTGARATARQPAEVNVIIDHETLSGGRHEHSIHEYSDGTPVPVEAARRHACDAKIIPVVLGTDGMPLDVGRAARHATPAQRAALRAMYRTCAVDGCDADFDRCEIHHLIEWALRNGNTDLANLLPLCSYHHHRAHEGRWRLQLEASTRELSVFLPDGALHCRSFPDIVVERAA